MENLQSRQGSSSFHAFALNFIYLIVVIFCHFSVPYIHELVFSFFNGLFLLLSLLIFFYINALLRTSSITYFSYLSLMFRISISVFTSALALVFIVFVTNTIDIIQRDKFLIFVVLIFSLQSSLMIVSKFLYSYLFPQPNKNVALITNVGELRNEKIVKFVSDDSVKVKEFKADEIPELLDHAIKFRVEAVYIYLDSKNLNELEKIFEDLSIFAFEIYWVLPESIFIDSFNPSSIKPIRLNPSPVSLDANQYLLKRSLDVIGSIMLLTFLSPILLLISILIKASDAGPVFYYQVRHGQHGKVFDMIKYRSMKVNSDLQIDQVKDDDDRVTWIGKYLRKTSLDEIPQLVNVLKGEMSLVGPRPQTLLEIQIYSQKLLQFLTRHHVKPGLTGLAQIRTRVKTDSVTLMQEKLQSDLEYINKWTFFLDIKILLNTPISLWKNRNTNT